jgi:hypothetical protein
MEPLKFIKEIAFILDSSNYRVTGNLTADKTVIEKWLLGKSF